MLKRNRSSVFVRKFSIGFQKLGAGLEVRSGVISLSLKINLTNLTVSLGIQFHRQQHAQNNNHVKEHFVFVLTC